MNITQTPSQWVIIKIHANDGVYHRVFGSWRGGYLDGDRWKLNSGIASVTQDEDSYYFAGDSGSVYKCHKKTYGVATSWVRGVLDGIIEKVGVEVVVMEDAEDWMFLNEINKNK